MEKIYNMELSDLYPSKNIIGMIESNGGGESCVLGFGGKV